MTILRLVVPIATFLVVLFGGHYLVYLFITRFFPISDPGIRKVILWTMAFLAIAIFPSALLVRFHTNIFTSLLYQVTSIWTGLFIYLFMAAILSWLIFGVGYLFRFSTNMRIISIGLVLIVAVVTVVGMWRAKHPKIKRIDVKIDTLPDHWRNRTIVHLSDVHLGVINGTGFLKRVVEQVNSLEPDLILITGDLFDGMAGDLSPFSDLLNSLKASKGIFFVTGNHEGYLGLDSPLSALKETGIRVLDDEIVDRDGLQIVGISYPEYQRQNKARYLLEESGAFDSNKPSILLYHTPTSIEEDNQNRADQQNRAYWSPDTTMTLAKEAGIDLQLSGHTHKGQFFPFGLLTRKIYNGYDYGLHRDGRFHIYVTSGTGTWGPPMRIGSSSEIVAIRLRSVLD
jgi:predicted MPP superfamily phosphohydrolase